MATVGLTPTSLEAISETARQNKNERFWGEALYHEGLREQIFYTISLKASTHTHTRIAMNNSDDALASYSADTSKAVNELPTHLQRLSRAKAVGSSSSKLKYDERICAVCPEQGWACITLICHPANAASWHHDMLTGAGLPLWCAEQWVQPSLPLFCLICNSVTNCQISGDSMELALYLKIELIRVWVREEHIQKSAFLFFVKTLSLFLSLCVTDFAKSSPYGGWRLGEKPYPEFLQNCPLLGW